MHPSFIDVANRTTFLSPPSIYLMTSMQSRNIGKSVCVGVCVCVCVCVCVQHLAQLHAKNPLLECSLAVFMI